MAGQRIVAPDTKNVVEANEEPKQGNTAPWHTVAIYRVGHRLYIFDPGTTRALRNVDTFKR